MKAEPKKTAAAQRAAYDAWYDEQVRLGLEDIEAGRVLSHEEVVKHAREQMVRLKKRYAQAA